MSQWNEYYNMQTRNTVYPTMENNTYDRCHFNTVPPDLLPPENNPNNYYQQNNFMPNVDVYSSSGYWPRQLELNQREQFSPLVSNNVFENNITHGINTRQSPPTVFQQRVYKLEPSATEFIPHGSNVATMDSSIKQPVSSMNNVPVKNQVLVNNTGAIRKNKQYLNYDRYQNNSYRMSNREYSREQQGHSSRGDTLKSADYKNKCYYSPRNNTGDYHDKNKDRFAQQTLDMNSDSFTNQRKHLVEQSSQRYSNNSENNSKNQFKNNYYAKKNFNNYKNFNNPNSNNNKSFNSFPKKYYNNENSDSNTRGKQHGVYVSNNLNRYTRKPLDFKYNTNNNKITSEKSNSPLKTKKYIPKVQNFSTLREKLTEEAKNGKIECLVCCELVRQDVSIWSCQNCYHILHLNCIKKWATSSKVENGGWRCPACQNVYLDIPSTYFCYCKKMTDPTYAHGCLPHSCGEICARVSKRLDCSHSCQLLCHPGPCPDCNIFVDRQCKCGATTQTVKCCSNVNLTCTNVCNKTLNCGIHQCQKICHIKECNSCEEKVEQVCYCGKKKQEVPCTAETSNCTLISCDEICGKLLSCGNHTCSKICHDGPCEECNLSPEFVMTCHCGQTTLTDEQKRVSCLDPIPCCEKVCNKELKCGQPHSPHTCSLKCHPGECPPCGLTTLVRCRCGHMDREIPCKQLTGRADNARCEKKCTKKRACGRHKCNKLCCIDIDHECDILCNRMLSCGKHKCESTCHRGRCMSCLQSSFEELYCECGSNVMYPPIPCGTKRPACANLCSRQHACQHPVMHNCHNEVECPPCTVLTTKWCYGRHEQRKTIPCYQKSFSCGLPCGKDLPCKRHKCILMCHEGECVVDGKICTQPCNIPRRRCGHPCGVSCHEGDCPNVVCKEMVKVSCQCGHRTTMRTCTEQSREYQRILTSLLVSKMKDVELGNSVDIKEVVDTSSVNDEVKVKILECNEECRIIERNRRLAIGLQIRNPDLSQKLTPRYSEFMKQWAKKDPYFCRKIHDKLTELVQLAKQSKQKSRSHSFESMNREKRQFIHEYCEHFGCESAAYDREPNRNVVATASKDKAWLPSYSLLEVVQRQAGHRKVPGPVLSRMTIDDKQVNSKLPISSSLVPLSLINSDTMPNRGNMSASSSLVTQSNSLESEKNLEENFIDYFDGPAE